MTRAPGRECTPLAPRAVPNRKDRRPRAEYTPDPIHHDRRRDANFGRRLFCPESFGEKGNDHLDGQIGNDILHGGHNKDKDTLTGGAGRDTFLQEHYSKSKWWKPTTGGAKAHDKLVDFDHTEDYVY